MVKFGVVQEGKTPSALSGVKSSRVDESGEALAEGETLKSDKQVKVAMEKLVCTHSKKDDKK